MPPPLNTVVFVISIVVDILNFLLAIIYPRLNIYRLISSELFLNLQRTNIFHLWESGKSWKQLQGSKSLFTTRMDVVRWYFPFLRRLVCCREDKTIKSWKYFHKSCYGVMVLENQPQSVALSQRVRGITMSVYCERYSRKRYAWSI